MPEYCHDWHAQYLTGLQVEVIDGVLHKGDRVTAHSSGENYDILEVGPFRFMYLMGSCLQLYMMGSVQLYLS